LSGNVHLLVVCSREFEDLRMIARIVYIYCRKTVVCGDNFDSIIAEFTRDWGAETGYYLYSL
jgi:hypothetical protein